MNYCIPSIITISKQSLPAITNVNLRIVFHYDRITVKIEKKKGSFGIYLKMKIEVIEKIKTGNVIQLLN